MQENKNEPIEMRFAGDESFNDADGEISASFCEVEDGCDEWVREVRSILKTQVSPLSVPYVGPRQGK